MALIMHLKVPAKFKNDAGLNYDRIKWRRKEEELIVQSKF